MAFVRKNWLNAVTGATTTDAEEITGTGQYGLQFSTTGSPTSGVITLQGSIDGTNWVTLQAMNVATDASGRIAWSLATVPGGTATLRPVVYIRLDLSGLDGGSSPTLSASVIAI